MTSPHGPLSPAPGMSRRTVAVNILSLLGILGAAILFLWLMSSLPRIEGPIQVRGVEFPASIARDDRGVPLITARTSHDAYFALGWAHSQDRMWQMELQRRVVSGRLAEIIGEKGLGNDRFMRTLGLYRLAEAGFEQLDQSTRDALTAYSDGVNAWLRSHWYRLPLEFTLLRDRPEPWKPADSLAWARLMGFQLVGNWQDDILRGRLAGKLTKEQLDQLFPGTSLESPTTLSSRTSEELLAAIPPMAAPRLASNLWVVDGSRTASGKPLLTNDPHLPFQAPVLWYLASVQAPGLKVSGATIPGIPFHLIGHNQRIAWGITTTHADTVDLFSEKELDNGASYLTPSGPAAFTTRQETIHVRGGQDVLLPIRQTRHGPVISDLMAKTLGGQGEVIAIKSTALEAQDLTAQGFNHLQRAANWQGFLDSVRDFGAPVHNIGYADTTGNIGFISAGKIPIRRSGDGSFPVRGWTSEGDWTGWVPFSSLPQSLNPQAGVLVNANNRVTPANYPYLITAHWPEPNRARRITDLLADRHDLTADNMATIQLDSLSLSAVSLKNTLTSIAPTTPLGREAISKMAAWDGRMDRNRPEPLIFSAWMRQYWHDIFFAKLGDAFPAFSSLRPSVLINLLTSHRDWCDGKASCEEMAARSLDATMVELAKRHGPDTSRWRWGNEHHAAFTNPILSAIPLLSTLSDISVETDGDDDTINRGSYPSGNFTHVHGPGLRVIFDLSDLENSRFVIATGQSGNVLSRHYEDLLPAWLSNTSFTIARHPKNAAILSLEPGN